MTKPTPPRIRPAAPSGATAQLGATPPAGSQRFSELLRQRREPAAGLRVACDVAPAASGLDATPAASPEPASEADLALPAECLPPLPAHSDLFPPPGRLRTIAGAGRDSASPRLAQRTAGGAATVDVAAADPAAERMVGRVAQTIASFCNDGAVSESEGWQVRMLLRPEVLPSTTLHLSISPHTLNLRFAIADPQARHIVCSHQQGLVQMLGESLSRPRDIQIAFD